MKGPILFYLVVALPKVNSSEAEWLTKKNIALHSMIRYASKFDHLESMSRDEYRTLQMYYEEACIANAADYYPGNNYKIIQVYAVRICRSVGTPNNLQQFVLRAEKIFWDPGMPQSNQMPQPSALKLRTIAATKNALYETTPKNFYGIACGFLFEDSFIKDKTGMLRKEWVDNYDTSIHSHAIIKSGPYFQNLAALQAMNLMGALPVEGSTSVDPMLTNSILTFYLDWYEDNTVRLSASPVPTTDSSLVEEIRMLQYESSYELGPISSTSILSQDEIDKVSRVLSKEFISR